MKLIVMQDSLMPLEVSCMATQENGVLFTIKKIKKDEYDPWIRPQDRLRHAFLLYWLEDNKSLSNDYIKVLHSFR